MILSDRQIKERLDAGSIVIKPLKDWELQIQPASVDLRLDDTFYVYKSYSAFSKIDPRSTKSLESYTDRVVIEVDKALTLHPGQFALGNTVEFVEVPADLTARIEGRSSYGRLAILVHATAGFIDPGFKGQITLELANLGAYPVLLYPGERISQIVFHQMSEASERPYGSPGRSSKYQGQTGPVMSRIQSDAKIK